jgi:RNA polymerase sigma-54 factor
MNIQFNVQHDLNVSQQLNLAPQLLQWLRLLQAPAVDLHDLVRNELEKNPALEIDGDSPAESADKLPDQAGVNDPDSLPETSETAANDRLDEKFQSLADIDDEWRRDQSAAGSDVGSAESADMQEKYEHAFNSVARESSLHEHLVKQLSIMNLSARDRETAGILLGSLDSKGYLATPVEDLAATTNIPAEDLRRILAIIQSLDPAGIGAENLRECLLLQMKSCDNAFLPKRVASGYLEQLARRLYADIATELHVTEEEVIQAAAYIRKLNPCPGNAFDRHTTHYIQPDVTLVKVNGKYEVELNDSRIPRLRLSASCRRLIEKQGISKEEIAYIRGKIRSATFLIQGIRQRQDTLRKVSEQIADIQRESLDSPGNGLKPLTMARVASIIGVHETTISRTISNKYIRTPGGVFEMKHFFRTGYKCADGTAMTPEAVKKQIDDVIRNEDAAAPLRDVDIAAIFAKRGLTLARRTIAKYRDELCIPSSKERTDMQKPGKKKTPGKPDQSLEQEDIKHPGQNLALPDENLATAAVA